MKSPTLGRAAAQVVANRARRRAGEAAEAGLEAVHHIYRAHTWDPDRRRYIPLPAAPLCPPAAVITRAHPPVRGKPGRAYYTGKGDVDFVGIAGGRPVAFDVKSVAGSTRYEPKLEELHQYRFLEAFRQAGGLAFLLCIEPRLRVAAVVTDFTPLMAGRPAALRASRAKVPTWVVPTVPETLLPCPAPVRGFDWLPMLPMLLAREP